MKYIPTIIFVLFFGCTDDDLVKYQPDHEIIGKWQLEATKISPGGIVDWSEVKNGEIYEFNADGTFLLSRWEDCKAPITGTFAIEEELLSIEISCSSTLYQPSYKIRFEDSKLILGFIGCIEECSYRYRPI
jgi:hypothetical protein